MTSSPTTPGGVRWWASPARWSPHPLPGASLDAGFPLPAHRRAPGLGHGSTTPAGSSAYTRCGCRAPSCRANALRRQGCSYSGYCGSFGCATGAKGSSPGRLAGRGRGDGPLHGACPHAKVSRLVSDDKRQGNRRRNTWTPRAPRSRVDADLFVVACQPIETVRLLLYSTGPAHPRRPRQPPRSARPKPGVLRRWLAAAAISPTPSWTSAGRADAGGRPLRQPRAAGLVRHRRPGIRSGRAKGGTVDFLLAHPNPVVTGRQAPSGRTASCCGDCR